MPQPSKPVPRVTQELAPFFAAAKEHRLAVQRCTGCGLLRFPAREVCSACWSRDSDWTTVSGRGEVFSFYLMHQLYHPGFAAEVPYPVAIVQLEEGPRITSNVVGCARDAIRIGMPVEAVFEDVSPDVTLPKFRPRSG
ncbi:MAG TPA: Zn-ribbon domain-containing OB-fold protein [Candidatus Binatia bacterium]|nr:Zn-ribbon domain-containing OB-fold protein [Candidatus Binatia bacterium]